MVVIAISIIEIAVALVPVVMVRTTLSMPPLYRVPSPSASERLTRSSPRYVVLRKPGMPHEGSRNRSFNGVSSAVEARTMITRSGMNPGRSEGGANDSSHGR
jgi:hypothetical protein